ncbi:MAG: maleylpyruvate isomerase N-terminal domain-containing protein [Acidimicrobiia bacterium]
MTATGTRSYEASVDALAEGLQALEDTLSSLSPEEWDRPTLLRPVDPDAPPWDVLTLGAHINFFMGMTLSLVGEPEEGQPCLDRASFCMAASDRGHVAPLVYQYMIDQAKGQTPTTIVDAVRQTFKNVLEAIRTTPPDTIGPAFFAPMRLDEFVPTRVVEVVIHGMDLTDAVGRPPLNLPKAIPIAAEILEEVLARVKVAGRPADLVGDDLAFIRAASGRGEHPDPRFPVVG